MTWYSFEVRGEYPNGNKAKMNGHVQVEGDDYPHSAFELAVKTCQDVTPGLIVDLAKPGRVILRKLKGKPRR